MSTVYINIGSNQGDRYANIERAVALIVECWPMAAVRRSDFFVSTPWGYQSDNEFVNIGLAIDFKGVPHPFSLLRHLQAIERVISDAPHRNADGSYCDRIIDIDLIAVDHMRVNTDVLVLPHPRAHLRDFVMVPLRQLGFRSF